MTSSQKIGLGFMAGVTTALIGASWQIVSRSAVLTPLGPLELAVLRYLLPAVLLLPITLRVGLLPVAVPRPVLCVLVCGSGLPFGLLAFAGTRFAPAAHMGVMIAATGPLMTAMLLWLIDRSRVTLSRGLGLALIAGGVLLLGASSLTANSSTWIGDALFLLAALVWSGYGIAFRASGLTPWQSAAVVNSWSALLLVPIVLLMGVDGFVRVDAATLALQAVWQGVVAGIFGLVMFTVAVRNVGASRAAAFGALVPVLSALGGWLFLAEPMTLTVAVASVLATVGVVFAVGFFERKAA